MSRGVIGPEYSKKLQKAARKNDPAIYLDAHVSTSDLRNPGPFSDGVVVTLDNGKKEEK